MYNFIDISTLNDNTIYRTRSRQCKESENMVIMYESIYYERNTSVVTYDLSHFFIDRLFMMKTIYIKLIQVL